MADPVVHLTNGIPDSGTGNITTLGQTLTDGANATLGANADAASATGSLSAKLRGIATALGLTALDLGSGTGGSRTLRIYIDPGSQNANGTTTDANSTPTAWSTEGKAQLGSLTETAPASDTASSGLNGRLQRIAQNITTLIAATLKVALQAATSGGLTELGIVTTAAAVVGNVKASAGQFYKTEVSNPSASWVYLKLYNTAGTPTAGSGTPQRRIGIPPTTTLLTTTDIGGVYTTGIGYAIVGGAPDADSTAVAANILVNFHYK